MYGSFVDVIFVFAENFKFGFVGLPEAPPAKEIEGLGQPPSFEGSHLIRGGGKGTSAYEMVLSPLPRNTLGCMKILGYQQLFRFKALLNVGVGKGAETIGGAEVSRPLYQGR